MATRDLWFTEGYGLDRVPFGQATLYTFYIHRYDAKQLKSNKPAYPYSGDGTDANAGAQKTQQFGVTLQQ